MTPRRGYRRAFEPPDRQLVRQLPEASPKPIPIGDKCNPLCPYFVCSKDSLRVFKSYYKGRTVNTPMCAWMGDKCLGSQCRYSSCRLRAMLPDGRCAYAVKHIGFDGSRRTLTSPGF